MIVYEMRTYTLHVGKMAEAVKLYTEFGYPALQKGGQDKKLIGYFQADTGMINQLVHLWKFNDDADRRAHWAAVYANKDFVDGFAVKFRPLLAVPGGQAADRRPVGAAPLSRADRARPSEEGAMGARTGEQFLEGLRKHASARSGSTASGSTTSPTHPALAGARPNARRGLRPAARVRRRLPDRPIPRRASRSTSAT